jgi:hypothetical protein
VVTVPSTGQSVSMPGLRSNSRFALRVRSVFPGQSGDADAWPALIGGCTVELDTAPQAPALTVAMQSSTSLVASWFLVRDPHEFEFLSFELQYRPRDGLEAGAGAGAGAGGAGLEDGGWSEVVVLSGASSKYDVPSTGDRCYDVRVRVWSTSGLSSEWCCKASTPWGRRRVLVRAGYTSPSAWVQYSPGANDGHWWCTVDTSSAGFTSDRVVYITSTSVTPGISHWGSTGSECLYPLPGEAAPSRRGFRVYVRSLASTENIERMAPRVHWVGFQSLEEEELVDDVTAGWTAVHAGENLESRTPP